MCNQQPGPLNYVLVVYSKIESFIEISIIFIVHLYLFIHVEADDSPCELCTAMGVQCIYIRNEGLQQLATVAYMHYLMIQTTSQYSALTNEINRGRWKLGVNVV